MTEEVKGLGASARAAAVRASIRTKITDQLDKLPEKSRVRVARTAAKLAGHAPKKQ